MTDSKRSAPAPAEEQTATLLTQLMTACGIQDRFINFSGNTELIARDELLAVLAAQGMDIRTPDGSPDHDKTSDALSKLKLARYSGLLPPVAVFTHTADHSRHAIEVNIAEHLLDSHLHWHTISEQGVQSVAVDVLLAQLPDSGQHQVNDVRYHQRRLELDLSSLPAGYHQLHVRITARGNASATDQTIPLILAPSRCYEPEWSAAGKKLWGFSVQLYSFCTPRSWGAGDFLDLANLIRKSAAQGASYLILNPLHAGPLNHPEHCSPYSPVDRRRLNPLYIAPELEPEFDQGRGREWLADNSDARRLLASAQSSEWIDYAGVTELKIRVLAIMFEDFAVCATATRKQAFEHFCQLAQRGLHDYARWQSQQGCTAAGQFSHNAQFYLYLQWLAESQLAACQQLTREVGMAVGLVRDLAVGSDRHGAEVTLTHGVFSTAASIGAPPDPLAPQGQNWGLPPLNPAVLREQAYAPFTDLLRSNMQHSGALRIDHVMSLMRLWWCPYEKSGQGAYVMYQADDLFAILRLESQRQQCLIIGEDLGIVPPEVRRHLDESGIYSNLLFYFEKATADSYRSPQHYTRRALAMLANHDVPTLAAWWNADDLKLRHELHLIADHNRLQHEINHRQCEKKQILQLLESQWLLPADRFGTDQLEKPMDTQLAAALMRCIARSSALMVSVQLEDLLLIELPVNIPGTSCEYKNWRRKMPVGLLAIMDNESVKPMLENLRVERR